MIDKQNSDARTAMTAGLFFMRGDAAAGLIVSDSGEKKLSFVHEGVTVEAELELDQQGPDMQAITLRLSLEKPVRFRVEWLVPEGVLNAAMTMNGSLLISPFSDIMPADGLPVPGAACGHGSPVSTLRPGHFQSLDFNWFPGDSLTLFLVTAAG